MSRNKTPAILFVAILLAALLVMVVPTTQAANFGDMGSKVKIGDPDFVPTLTTSLPVDGAFLRQREVSAQYTAWYIHFGASGDTSITAGRTFRLTCGTDATSCPSDAKEGLWVRSGDPDMATPTIAPASGTAASVTLTDRVKYLESDGRPGWTFGDGLYVDVDNNGALNAGDLRIVAPKGFSCSTCPLSREVETGDTDLTRTTSTAREHPLSATYASGAFELAWFDAHRDGAISFQDVFYLKGGTAPTVGSPNSKHPDVGDARITELASNPFSGTVDHGTIVAAGNPDHKRTLTEVDPGLAVVNGPDAGETDKTKQHLVLHFADPDGTNNHLLYGDVFLYKGPSGGSAGTLVTSEGSNIATSPGTGSAIESGSGYVASAKSLLRYHDESPTGYSANDAIYLKHPLNSGSNVEIGDIRITTRLSLSAGTMVKSGDLDINNVLTSDSNLVIKRYDNDGANEVHLNSLSNVYRRTGGGDDWAPATEGLYLSCSGSTPLTVADCSTRLRGPAGSPTATAINCPGDADCGHEVATYSKLSVTGPDSTWDQAQSENVYDRTESNRLTVGDLRVTQVTATLDDGTTVAASDADITWPSLESSDALIVSYDPTTDHDIPFMRIGDVFIYGSSFGTRVTTSTTGFVPTLTQYATESSGDLYIVRFNRGDTGSAQDDTYYATFTNSATLSTGDIRITPITSTDKAGTLIKSGDSFYTQEVGGGSSFTVDTSRLTTRVCYIDVDSRAGLSLDDPVYLTMDNAVFGSPFSASTTTINPYDLRITGYPLTGTEVHDPGTIIVAGNDDVTSGQTTCASKPAGQTWFFRYFDQNNNGRYDSSGTSQTDDDVGYLVLGTTLNHAPPPLHAVRMTGPGGSSDAVSEGTTGGGGTTTPTSGPSVPSLSSGVVTPEFVDAGGAQTFQVTYTHGGNKAPATKNVVIDGSTYTMTSTATTYSAGSTFTLTRTMNTAGEFPFYFEFKEGTTTVRFPTSGSLTAYVGPEENVAPTLSGGNVAPDSGDSGTDFTFTVRYKDANNDAPVDPTVHIDLGGTTETVDLSCSGTAYYKGVTCTGSTSLSTAGTLGYHFTVSDGTEDARLPASGTESGPTVSEPGATGSPSITPSESPTGSPTETSTEPVPTPGPGLVVILSLLGIVVVLARRSRRA